MISRHQDTTRDPHDVRGLRTALYLRVSRDSGDEKSVRDQEAEARAWAAREGVEITHVYRDVSLSASEFARKARPGYGKVLALIADDAVDLVWLWALNRATRQGREYLDLGELCQAHGVRWVIGGKVYNLDDDDDTLGLDLHNIMDRRYSKKLSRDVKRGKVHSAHEGRRGSRAPYGYRPRYVLGADGQRQWEGDDPDEKPGPGGISPAAVVREVYGRVLAGESLTKIRRNLNERGIRKPGNARSPEGYAWHNQTLRTLVLNPAYAGWRVFRRADHDTIAGAILRNGDGEPVKGNWPPLVDEGTWWATYRLLDAPERKTSRPGRGVHMLSAIATCAKCGSKLVRRAVTAKGASPGLEHYVCRDYSHVAIDKQLLDEFVSERMITWLADPLTAAALQPSGDSAAEHAARQERDKASDELESWRKAAERGDIEEVDEYIRFAKGAKERIKAASARLAELSAPPPVVASLGPQARAGWEKLDVPQRRQVIAAVAAIKVHPTVRGCGRGHGPGHPAYRVTWTWKLHPHTTMEPMSWAEHEADMVALKADKIARRDYVSTQRRETITAIMRADPELPDRQVAIRAGRIDRHGIRRIRHELEAAGEIPVIRHTRWSMDNHGYLNGQPGEAYQAPPSWRPEAQRARAARRKAQPAPASP